MKKLSLSLTLVAIVAMFLLTLCQSCGSKTDDKAAINKKIKALLAECSNPPKDTSLLNILPLESKDSGYYIVENKDETSPFYAYKVNPNTSKIQLGYENDFMTEEEFQALMDIRNGKTSGVVDELEDELSIDEFTTFPEGWVDGCGTSYASDKKSLYDDKRIGVENKDALYLNIGGNITKFILVKGKEGSKIKTYNNENFELIITIKTSESGEETISETGTMELKNKSGKSINKTYFSLSEIRSC